MNVVLQKNDGGEDPDHPDEYHPPVEESDGAGSGHCPLHRGGTGPAAGDGHHQRPAEAERREAAHGLRGDRQRGGAGHRGYRDPEKDQRRADPDPGRCDEDPAGRPCPAPGRRGGNG